MNHDDERDFEEENANRRAMEQEAEEEAAAEIFHSMCTIDKPCSEECTAYAPPRRQDA